MAELATHKGAQREAQGDVGACGGGTECDRVSRGLAPGQRNAQREERPMQVPAGWEGVVREQKDRASSVHCTALVSCMGWHWYSPPMCIGQLRYRAPEACRQQRLPRFSCSAPHSRHGKDPGRCSSLTSQDSQHHQLGKGVVVLLGRRFAVEGWRQVRGHIR